MPNEDRNAVLLIALTATLENSHYLCSLIAVFHLPRSLECPYLLTVPEQEPQNNDTSQNGDRD